MATRITGSTKRIEVLLALGQRSAERLAGNADLADLVPAVGQAMERLEQARVARRAAANARWLTRGAMEDAGQAVTQAVRALQFHALEACSGDRADAGYRALFPDDRRGLVEGSMAQREQALRSLAVRMGVDPANAAGAQRLNDALAAWQGAVEAWKTADRFEHEAVRALTTQARAYRREISLVRCQAIVRLKDPEAVRAYFPTLARNRVSSEPEPAVTASEPPDPKVQVAA